MKYFSIFMAFVWMIIPAIANTQPNVIIFIADDISWNDYSCYGNQTIQTPNIDKLAKNGLIFDNAFLTASSCSPSRASIMTGRYPHNTGEAQNLHHKIPSHLPWITDVLKNAGYYTVLSGKNHMTKTNKPNPFEVTDSSNVKGKEPGGHALWTHHVKNRDKSRPFFYWFASNDAHRGWDTKKKYNAELLGPRMSLDQIKVPPYMVDDEATRKDLRYYFEEVVRFDLFIGKTVKALEEDGILDNTLLFVLADNGRPFPRAKTRLHDSGMKTCLVAHWPKGIKQPGNRVSNLVSVIDLAPTIFDAAGVSIGETFQGVSLNPIFQKADSKVRDYVFSEHNWHDHEALGRSVRYGDFLYIENHRPNLPWQGPNDSVSSPSHKSIQVGFKAGTLTRAQSDVLMAPRSKTELYMNSKDDLQINNLSGKAEYSQIEKQLKKVLQRWAKDTGDTYPEKVKPDRFNREVGGVIKGFDEMEVTWSYAGESTQAHKINAKGPVLK